MVGSGECTIEGSLDGGMEGIEDLRLCYMFCHIKVLITLSLVTDIYSYTRCLMSGKWSYTYIWQPGKHLWQDLICSEKQLLSWTLTFLTAPHFSLWAGVTRTRVTCVCVCVCTCLSVILAVHLYYYQYPHRSHNQRLRHNAREVRVSDLFCAGCCLQSVDNLIPLLQCSSNLS